MPKHELRNLYPEVHASGSLQSAMQSALAAIDSPLVAEASAEFFPGSFARIKRGPRFSQTYIAALERLFMPDFWSHGVQFATGQTPDLAATASAIHDWLTIGNLTTAELALRYPWITPSEKAAVFESGNAVEWTWTHMLESTNRSEATLVAIRRAYQEPALRCLFPYTSMFSLCFSRCTGYPYTQDISSITPVGDGLYAAGESDGPKDIDGAIAAVLRSLPPGCGPARPGTADDM